jgi:hypothetical protein
MAKELKMYNVKMSYRTDKQFHVQKTYIYYLIKIYFFLKL